MAKKNQPAQPLAPQVGVLVDTDVWIDFLRGHERAVAFVSALPEVVFISAVSVAELHVGVREGPERRALSQLIATLQVLEVTAEIAVHGGLLRRDWGRSHGVGLNDALIAATALSHATSLATLNLKHYPMLEARQIHTAYPKD